MVVPEISAFSQEPIVVSAPGSNPGVPFCQELIALRAVFGQDEANHGAERYRVGNDGLVWVPLEAVAFLTSKGGFVLAKSTTGPVPVSGEAQPSVSTQGLTPAARGKLGRETVKLHHENAAGCSYDGREYPGDENGDVLVPAEAARELTAHGFVPVPQAAGAPKPSQPAPSVRSRKG